MLVQQPLWRIMKHKISILTDIFHGAFLHSSQMRGNWAQLWNLTSIWKNDLNQLPSCFHIYVISFWHSLSSLDLSMFISGNSLIPNISYKPRPPLTFSHSLPSFLAQFPVFISFHIPSSFLAQFLGLKQFVLLWTVLNILLSLKMWHSSAIMDGTQNHVSSISCTSTLIPSSSGQIKIVLLVLICHPINLSLSKYYLLQFPPPPTWSPSFSVFL